MIANTITSEAPIQIAPQQRNRERDGDEGNHDGGDVHPAFELGHRSRLGATLAGSFVGLVRLQAASFVSKVQLPDGSVAQRHVDGTRDLLSRAGAHRAAQRACPTLGAHLARVQSQVGEDSGLVDVPCDLLGAALRRGVLDANEPGTPVLGRDPQQVLGDFRDRPARALLPRRVSGGVDDDLADDPPPAWRDSQRATRERASASATIARSFS